MRVFLLAFAVAASAVAVASGTRVHAQAFPDAPNPTRWEERSERVLLDVPYVAQEWLLCGAASIEMALRYAGARGVYARDFRRLVREDEGGIRTDELAAAVSALGWRIRAGPSDLRELARDLAAARPATVLLAEGPGRYHYVLVVGSTRDSVLVHDPGRRPGVSLAVDDFVEQWEAAGSWSMVLLVGPDGAAREDGTATTEGAPGVVAPDARVGRPPGHPHPLLERASVLFREGRWRDAADSARVAAAANPSDPRAWALLGTSRYLAGDPRGALQAWGRANAPVVDRVVVTGLARTRHPVVLDLLGLRPGEPLLSAALDRARRRLTLLPSARSSLLSYRALPGGVAVVEGAVVERGLPAGASWLAAIARGVASSEAHVELAGPTGGGESATLLLRWAEARPAVAVTLAAPMPRTLPGVLALNTSWHEERHQSVDGKSVHVEARTRARLSLTDWATGWLRWQVGGGVDRWHGVGPTGTAHAELEVSAVPGSAGLTATLEVARGPTSAPRYLRWSVEGSAEALPPDSPSRAGLRVLAAGVGAHAPGMVMPGADVGRAREGLLRAHTMEVDGVLAPLTLGRALVNASLELERVVATVPFARLSVAAFIDVATISPADESKGARGFLDGGVGLRIGTASGAVRVDVARSTDGSRALSLGWQSRRNGSGL